MKKNYILLAVVFFTAASVSLSSPSHELETKGNVSVQASNLPSEANLETEAENIAALSSFAKPITTDTAELSISFIKAKTVMNKLAAEQKIKEEQNAKNVAVAVAAPKQPVLSRGGSLPQVNSTSKKVENLDWWKAGNKAFPIGSVVTVKDVYTGKTFKIKRTMGSNHADCEALTLADTNVIKSIWGGFSWDVRPVHIFINGRVLAASMSGQPHAGVDSAPAYATVNNRSENYGTGENLDTIKGNGMDGHFDVHFLNSQRHKDGQVDPRHQAAIKIAASKPE